VNQTESAGVEQPIDIIGKQIGGIEHVEIAIRGHVGTVQAGEARGVIVSLPTRSLRRAPFVVRAVRLSARFGCPRGSAVRAFRLSARFGCPRSSAFAQFGRSRGSAATA